MLEESAVEKESFREKLMQLEREKASFQSIIEGKDSDCKVLQKRLEDKTDGEEQAMQKVQLLESDIQSMNHNTDNLKSALQSEKVTVLELQRSLAETKTQLKLTKVLQFPYIFFLYFYIMEKIIYCVLGETRNNQRGSNQPQTNFRRNFERQRVDRRKIGKRKEKPSIHH